MIRFLVGTLLLAALAALAIPNLVRARTTRAKNTCPDVHLAALAQAKTDWARQHNRPPSAVPSTQDLLPWLPGRTWPACPAGGNYSINTVGRPPTCSHLEHTRQFLQDRGLKGGP